MSKHEDLLKQKKIKGVKFVWIHDSLWRCPNCGGSADFIYDPDDFHPEGKYIDIAPAKEIKGWLVVDAYIECEEKSCGYGTTVSRFFTKLSKNLSMVPCPHCRGTGLIQDKKGKTS